MPQSAKFKLKDDSSEIAINKSQIQEIIPDADFRFSLIILNNGDKHFVFGSEKDINESFE